MFSSLFVWGCQPAVLRDLQRDILQNVETRPALTLHAVALSK
jgi:hypothetical protein